MKLFGWTVAREARPVLARGTLVNALGAWPQNYAAQVREGYARNAVAQRAVKLVAQGVAEVPLDAPAALTDLLKPRGGAPGILESVAAQLLLHGNAFVQVTADAGGERLLYPLRPERVSVEQDALGWPVAYLYRVTGRETRLTAEPPRPQVIHVRSFNPGDDLYGLGCLGVAAGAIAVHNAAAQWNKALLDNAARPSGALVYDPGTDQACRRSSSSDSLTFEAAADAGAVASGAIVRELGDGVIGDAAAGPALGGFSAYGDSARSVIELLTQATGAWFADGGAGLALCDAADDGAVTAIADDGVAGGRRVRTVAPIETVPRMLALSHYDPARDYQAGVQAARRAGAGWRDERVELPAAVSADAAKTLAEAMLARAEAARVQRVVTTDSAGLAIAPGARVGIAGEAGVWRVTRAELEAMMVRLTLTPLIPAPLPATASAGRVLPSPDRVPGATVLAAFETPALADELLTQPRLTIVAAGTAAGWRRAALLYSLDDGASWSEAGATAAPGVIGALDAPLGIAPATLVDRRNTIEVALANATMELVGSDAAGIERGVNLALVGDELVQFETAEEIAAGRWRLAGLRRGLRGTAPRTHPAGARFALLEDDVAVTLALPATAVGHVVRVMASGVGDATPVEVAAAIDGRSFLPPAPVRLRIADGVVRWTRRSRIGWQWRDGVDAPLGEESERYRVTVTTADGARDAIVDTPALALLPAEAGATGLTATVRQLGTNGEGAAAIL